VRGSATRILRCDGESAHQQQDDLAEEEPLEIRVRGRAISVTMRTPGHDAELAAGVTDHVRELGEFCWRQFDNRAVELPR